ncbi:DUF2971 domain-containing protein [Methylococcaceae bacterium WWC4]|nr:DUF2971 domain-containing protein [Methylococcaceae bacterium WWC4]
MKNNPDSREKIPKVIKPRTFWLTASALRRFFRIHIYGYIICPKFQYLKKMIKNNNIFHYTSIESLAMILSSKKLRFSRFDHLDDVLEAQTNSRIAFGKYFFASCWTQQSEESVPQWSMYGNNMQGVRIELPKYPFRKIAIEPKQYRSWLEVCHKPIIGPLSIDECDNEKYFIQPNFFEDFFDGPVEYVPDVKARYDLAIQTNENQTTIIEPNKLPRLKSDHWSFQSEYRFHLWVLPKPNEPLEPSENLGIRMIEEFKNGVELGINFIDVPLDPSVFNSLVIRTGPLCTPGGIVCIKALMAMYAPNAKIENSHFKDKIRQI